MFSYTCLAIAQQTPNETSLLATVHSGEDPISSVAKYNGRDPAVGSVAPFWFSGVCA